MSRITLQPIRRSDGPDLVIANRESRAHHRPYADPFQDMDGFHLWYDQLITTPTVALLARNASEEGAKGGIVGVFTFSQIALGNFRSAYLGYYGQAAFAGRGLMTEALKSAVAYAFEELRLHRIEANIQPENHRSIALAKRCGFEKEGYSPLYLKIAGEWRDHERWTRLAKNSASL
ncbi:GNAT family N-acetyltransferase [Rhizobium paknamense]|uniref:Ribosomal-protein-alanine N-acetyltransferase n=1 Tax=Rhizobium paknamense TaxID=1206817 RepID=A0ABU0I819_9HYPH|nr:GNAT family N-acetyltransferase [Rhizobium paknamense]MDQ0454365.1 ribosomal-protein-alanine N-acetyltransferase [Rhizobium paknamense]